MQEDLGAELFRLLSLESAPARAGLLTREGIASRDTVAEALELARGLSATP